MLTNYFKVIWRHLQRHKSYVLINVIGLSLALALCMVGYLNWKFDYDYDRFHAQQSEIYRVEAVKKQNSEKYGFVPVALADRMVADHPAVTAAAKMDRREGVIRFADQTPPEGIHFAKADFMEMMTFPLVEGTLNLNDPAQIALTERMAKKYFGEQNAIGKTLTIFADTDFRREVQVSGVLKNVPKNSSINMDFLTSLNNRTYYSESELDDTNWSNWIGALFLKIDDAEQLNSVTEQLQSYVAIHQATQKDADWEQFMLDPMVGLADRAREVRWNILLPDLPPSAIWGNIIMALLILLTACLNFANTTISLAGRRLREIGVRKVMGGTQRQIAIQLLGESFLICAIAAVLSIPLADMICGAYNQMWEYINLNISVFDNYSLIVFLIGVTILTSLIAGSYPAFYVSSFSPKRIFQGNVQFGGTNLLSRILLGTQVAISLVTIVTGLMFAYNAQFQQTADLGYERNGIQAVQVFDEATFTTLQNEVSKLPAIQLSAGANSHIGDVASRTDIKIAGQNYESEFLSVGDNYLEVMGLKIVAGRGFDYQLETDRQETIVVDEKFVANFLPNEDPIGKTVTVFDNESRRIIGVVQSFMQDNFFDPMRPTFLTLSNQKNFEHLVLKTNTNQMLEVRDALAAIWKTNFPNKPFRHKYQSDFLVQSVTVTNNIKWSMLAIAFISILLTITGLSALVSLNVLKRAKEVAIRRVLGASMGGIFYLLNRQFSGVLLFGCIAGITGGAYLSMMLLDSIYQVHSGLSYSLLLISGIAILLVILGVLLNKLRIVAASDPAQILQE
ncbi:MAG: ABC transporter permease [Saprospiraceae bacterium]